MTWAPDSNTSEHLTEIRSQTRNEDAGPNQVLTPILYMRSEEQYIGWAYAEQWLREKRVRLRVTGLRGWFTLAVMWFPTATSRIHYDFRFGHKLCRSPEGVAARAINLRFVSGLPIQTQAPQVTTLGSMIYVGSGLDQYLGRPERCGQSTQLWQSRCSRVFPWELQSSIMNHNPKNGAPFLAEDFQRYKEQGRVSFLEITELPIRPEGWLKGSGRHHHEGVREMKILRDLSAHISPMRTTRPPWC